MIITKIKSLSKNSIVYGFGSTFQKFIGFLLLPFFTSVLSTEDYGVIALIALIGVAMSGFLSLGTTNSMGLLYFREDEKDKRQTIVWSTTLLMLVNSFLIYIIIYFTAPYLSNIMFQTETYSDLIRISFLGSVIINIYSPWLAYLRMEEKAKKYVILTFSGTLINVVLSVWFVLFLNYGIKGLLLAMTIGNFLMLFLMWYFVGRKLSYQFDYQLITPLIRIGFPSIFGVFAFMLIDYLDRQMIERMIGLSELGIYMLGYSFGMLMIIPMEAFSVAWSPFFMSFVKKREEAKRLFGKIFTYYIIFFSLLIVCLFFISKPITSIMLASKFSSAWIVVGLVGAGYALKGCYLILLPGIYFANKLKMQSAIEWIAALINIALNLWMIPIYGIVGAAFATFLSYLSLPVLTYFVSIRYLKVNYEWNRVVSMFLITSIFSFIIYKITDSIDKSVLKMVMLNLVLLFIYFKIVYSYILKYPERKLIISNIKSLKY